jgi:hypothetical protein
VLSCTWRITIRSLRLERGGPRFCTAATALVCPHAEPDSFLRLAKCACATAAALQQKKLFDDYASLGGFVEKDEVMLKLIDAVTTMGWEDDIELDLVVPLVERLFR